MPVLINFKICDNAPECGGIEVCPTGALSWNEEDKKIVIDNSKCTNCNLCVAECPIEAIKVAQTDEEYDKIKKEIDEDSRKISDLFVDRYGAMPIDPDTVVEEEDFDKKVIDSTKSVLVELFKDEDINCLKSSIPIRELIPGRDIIFKKIKINKKDLIDRYKINKLPCLLFIKDKELVDKIEGYYDRNHEKELKEKIKELINP